MPWTPAAAPRRRRSVLYIGESTEHLRLLAEELDDLVHRPRSRQPTVEE